MILFIALTALAIITRAAAQRTGHYTYGPSWGIRRIQSGLYVTNVESTLIPEKLPDSPKTNMLAIWQGIDTMTGGLLQPAVVPADSLGAATCGGATSGKWCVAASLYKPGALGQIEAKHVLLSPGQPMVWRVKYDAGSNGYFQEVLIGNKVVSQLGGKGEGKGKSFYVSTECAISHSGKIAGYTITNTTITLSQADPNWGRSPDLHYMACADSVSSPDGGKTWKIPKITLQDSVAPKDYVRSPTPKGAAICGK